MKKQKNKITTASGLKLLREANVNVQNRFPWMSELNGDQLIALQKQSTDYFVEWNTFWALKAQFIDPIFPAVLLSWKDVWAGQFPYISYEESTLRGLSQAAVLVEKRRKKCGIRQFTKQRQNLRCARKSIDPRMSFLFATLWSLWYQELDRNNGNKTGKYYHSFRRGRQNCQTL